MGHYVDKQQILISATKICDLCSGFVCEKLSACNKRWLWCFLNWGNIFILKNILLHWKPDKCQVEDKTPSYFFGKMLLARTGKCFTQLWGVVTLIEPWQACPETPTFTAGAAAEHWDHKLLSLLSCEATAAEGHCYNASTSLSFPELPRCRRKLWFCFLCSPPSLSVSKSCKLRLNIFFLIFSRLFFWPII